DGAVLHGNPEGGAVEAALHALHHQAGGPSRPGGGGNDVDRSRTGPAEVLVHEVEQVLVVGVRVHRRHEPPLHTEGVVEHLDHRHEAVGGARGVGDDGVLGGIEGVVVDADHEDCVDTVGGCRDDHTLRTRVDVGGGLLPVGE